jgi:hypothetical protein
MRSCDGVFRIILVTVIFLISMNEVSSLASPPPSEVEKKKSEAEIHLTGTVTSDVLVKDVTKDKKYPEQLRKMTIEVTKLMKSPAAEQDKTSLEVFYSYIPSWQEDLYTGGKRIDIAEGDVIETWLSTGDLGWEPALSGYTVKHIHYAADRNEPIREPFMHAVKRNITTLFEKYTEATVLALLSISLLVLAWKALKK